MSVESPSVSQDSLTLLVIDDDPLVSVIIRRSLQGIVHRLHSAPDIKEGLAEIASRQPDLIVLDNILPDGLGVEALPKIHAMMPDAPILFITAKGSGGTAIEAMRLGAFDYLTKPLEAGVLRSQIDRAISLQKLSRSIDESSTDGLATSVSESVNPLHEDTLIGQCQAMQTVFKSIGKVAEKEVAILIRGEHGTGKESVAREIHRHGNRSETSLLKIHCRGYDEERLAEELFGRAATSSENLIKGAIAEAAGGTLVLQEVGSLPLPLQAKLLRAVRDGFYEPQGSKQEKKVECRFIAITSDDLESKSRASEFRSDLYYALSSYVIALPPLRQRHGDLALLIKHRLKKLLPLAKSYGVSNPHISSEAMQTLCNHVWPGNIDELESVLKRALIEQKGNILLASDLLHSITGEQVVPANHLTESSKYSTDWAGFTQLRIDSETDTLHADAVADTERKIFECVLRHTSGNQAHAARILGITRASLRKKLRIYGMVAKPIQE